MPITPVIYSGTIAGNSLTPASGTIKFLSTFGAIAGNSYDPSTGTTKVLPIKGLVVYTFKSSVQINPLTLVGQIYPKLK